MDEWNELCREWTRRDGSRLTVVEAAAQDVPRWLRDLRRQYPGQLERRAMEYMGQPGRVASGRERLGE